MKSLLPLIRYFLAYLALPNLAFFVVGRFVYSVRPIINLDYAVLGVLAPFLRARTVLFFYACLLLVDCIGTFSAIFNFHLADVFIVAPDISNLDIKFTLGITAVVLLVIGVFSKAAILISGPRRRFRPSEMFGVFVLVSLFVLVDVSNGTSLFSYSQNRTSKSFLSSNIAGSGVYKLASEGLEAFAQTRRSVSDSFHEKAESASYDKLRTLLDGVDSSGVPLKNVVLVVVESLGQFKDEAANARLVSPFLTAEVQARYQVKFGQVPFDGSTVPGEFRELCGLKVSFGEYLQKPIPECLPWLFRNHGFKTVSIHGFTDDMFNRFKWYPFIGFEKSLFIEDVLATNPRFTRCGSAFPGICDTEIARTVFKNEVLSPEPEKRFVYWLTLNSHFPIDEKSTRDIDLDCQGLGPVSEHEDICLLMRVFYGVFSEVAKIAIDPSLPDTHFILVGDHSPPSFLEEKRRLFVEGQVPFIELVPISKANP